MTDHYMPLFGRPVTPWHRWFAWRPVDTVDRGIRWFRFVNRRRIQKLHGLDGGGDLWFQFAVDIQGENQ